MMTAKYQPKNMLVTGGAGFIGANFIHYINKTQPEIKIVNLDKLTYAGSLENLENLAKPEQHQFIKGDICNVKLITEILTKHNIDTIVHFAAESHVDRSISGPAAFIQSNLIGTFSLLEAARMHWLNNDNRDQQSCRFHHISTDEVFGSLNASDPLFTETTAYQPRSPYSASKAGSDHLVDAYYHTYGLPITLSNCSNNYGPRQHSEKLIPTIINACLAEKAIPIYGNGSNIRDWLYVEDHCKGIWLIIENGAVGEHYNIGGDNEWDNLALAKKICQLMDTIKPGSKPYETLIEFVEDRAGHDFRYAIDASKMMRELNWKATTNLSSGLENTIRFYTEIERVT